MAACWGERRRGAHLQGRAAAGGRQGAAGAHPGPAGLPEVGRVVPTDAWQGGCGAVAREKQSRSDPRARGTTASGQGGHSGSVPAWFPGRGAQTAVPGHRGELQNRLLCSPCTCPLRVLSTKGSPGRGSLPRLPRKPPRSQRLAPARLRNWPRIPTHHREGGNRAPQRPAPRTFARGGRGCCRVPPRNGAG